MKKLVLPSVRIYGLCLVLVLAVCATAAHAYGDDGAPTVEVRVEEDVYDFVSPDNGSGPLWSYGCTVIARSGEDVIVSQMETGEGVPKLCNTRWRLLRREDDGCRQVGVSLAQRG